MPILSEMSYVLQHGDKTYWALRGGAVLSDERMRKFIAMYAPRTRTLVEMMEEIDKIASFCVPIRDDLRDSQ